MARLPIFKGSWPWPWIGPYCIPSCITRRPLPTCQMSLKSKKFSVDGRTFETGPALLGHLCRRVDLKSETSCQLLCGIQRCCWQAHLHHVGDRETPLVCLTIWCSQCNCYYTLFSNLWFIRKLSKHATITCYWTMCNKNRHLHDRNMLHLSPVSLC